MTKHYHENLSRARYVASLAVHESPVLPPCTQWCIGSLHEAARYTAYLGWDHPDPAGFILRPELELVLAWEAPWRYQSYKTVFQFLFSHYHIHSDKHNC